MSIDFHQHVWPDGVRRLLEPRRTPPYLRGRSLVLPVGGVFEVDPDAYAPEARLAELDRADFDRAVVSLAPTTEPTPDLVEVWHAEARELAAGSDGRLVPLAYEAALPDFDGAILGASRFGPGGDVDELLANLELLDQFAFVHPAASVTAVPDWITSGVAYTQQMLAAYAHWLTSAQRHTSLKVVFALLGGGAPFQVERLVRRGLDPQTPFTSNAWFDTSSYGQRALELTLQTFGVAQLLFGSDAPIDKLDDTREALARFGPALEAEVLVSNPLALLTQRGQRWAA